MGEREACHWFCAASHEHQRARIEHPRATERDAEGEINFRYRRQPAAPR